MELARNDTTWMRLLESHKKLDLRSWALCELISLQIQVLWNLSLQESCRLKHWSLPTQTFHLDQFCTVACNKIFQNFLVKSHVPHMIINLINIMTKILICMYVYILKLFLQYFFITYPKTKQMQSIKAGTRI